MTETQLFETAKLCSEHLVRRKITVAFAESCTAGLLTYAFGRIAGISQVLMGSIVGYSDSWKSQFLGVDPDLIKTRGAVSAETVEKMATYLQQQTAVKWVASISGIAGPGAGSSTKPVGTVWVGSKCQGHPVRSRRYLFPGDRLQVQIQSAAAALDMMREDLGF
jgi:PncC family amidohydrolase